MSLVIYYHNDNRIIVDGLQDVVTNSFKNDATLELTLCYEDDSGVITGATNATPIVITSAAHGLSNGDSVHIRKIAGNTAAYGVWTVANKTTNTFELVDSVGNSAFIDTSTEDDPAKWYRVVPGVVKQSMTYVAGSSGKYYYTLPGTVYLRAAERYRAFIRDIGIYLNKFDRWPEVVVTDAT